MVYDHLKDFEKAQKALPESIIGECLGLSSGGGRILNDPCLPPSVPRRCLVSLLTPVLALILVLISSSLVPQRRTVCRDCPARSGRRPQGVRQVQSQVQAQVDVSAGRLHRPRTRK